MTARWLMILLMTPWFGGCGATTIVTPELKLGPTVVTLTTDIAPTDIESQAPLGEQPSFSALAVGLISTFHF